MGTLTYPTLEHVAMQARPYPAHLLKGCDTGLCLFAAAFLGHNDAIHYAEAGLTTTCIDTNGPRLMEMKDLYPADWQFHVQDAWQFARRAAVFGKHWDAVSVDTFTGAATAQSLDSIPLWTSLARRVVTCTITGDIDDIPLPAGWLPWLSPRATGVYWLVLERA